MPCGDFRIPSEVSGLLLLVLLGAWLGVRVTKILESDLETKSNRRVEMKIIVPLYAVRFSYLHTRDVNVPHICRTHCRV